MRPHRWQPTRLPHLWDSLGKNPGVGCHFLFQCMKVKSQSEVAQSCLTLCDPIDCSLPGSSVHGIFQARVLEWGAIAFSTRCCYSYYFRFNSGFTGICLIAGLNMQGMGWTASQCPILSVSGPSTDLGTSRSPCADLPSAHGTCSLLWAFSLLLSKISPLLSSLVSNQLIHTKMLMADYKLQGNRSSPMSIHYSFLVPGRCLGVKRA